MPEARAQKTSLAPPRLVKATGRRQVASITLRMPSGKPAPSSAILSQALHIDGAAPPKSWSTIS
eukprot:7128259-Pyramimonas_sp.AAC.1